MSIESLEANIKENKCKNAEHFLDETEKILQTREGESRHLIFDIFHIEQATMHIS